MIPLDALARFEDLYSVSRRTGADPTAEYDWEAFNIALMIRVHEKGLPESMTELVDEMQDWFVRHSASGYAPDESAIRKQVSPIWHRLRAGVSPAQDRRRHRRRHTAATLSAACWFYAAAALSGFGFLFIGAMMLSLLLRPKT